MGTADVRSLEGDHSTLLVFIVSGTAGVLVDFFDLYAKVFGGPGYLHQLEGLSAFFILLVGCLAVSLLSRCGNS